MVALKQRLEIRQGQSLIMTPQLQQSLKLLQLSAVELAEYIESELEKNPLLERAEATHEPQSENSDNAADSNAESDGEQDENKPALDKIVEREEFPERDFESEDTWSAADIQPENQVSYENTSLMITAKGGRTDFGDGNFSYDNILSKEITLRDHILSQINLDFTDPAKRFAAIHLLDTIDENGYISGDLSIPSQTLQCEPSFLENILKELQKFDPAGIFARSLSECLALQLEDRDRLDPAMEKMLANLELLGKGEYTKLQKICDVDKEDFDEMLRELKSLNPKPGNNFSPEIVQTTQVDIFLRRRNDGSFSLELNNEALPKLLVNNQYYSEVKAKVKNDDEKKYVMEQMSNANWLIKTLHQRAETILKVATEIVDQQREFFEKGIYYLKPMVLRDIAEKLDIHESTVGRVTSNKYMSTPRGLYELKFFFSSSINNSSGEDEFSSKTVKHLIGQLIEKEPQDDILSDDKIAEILKTRGINVARRTVAKYREALNIPTSGQRKRRKIMNG